MTHNPYPIVAFQISDHYIYIANSRTFSRGGILMNLVEKYKKYRKVGMNLNNKIMETSLDHDIIMEAARLLGIARGENVLMFETEDESSVLMDFILNDYRVNSQSIIAIYRDKMGWENEIEKEILEALLSAYTSLFRITSISKGEKIVLEDLINRKEGIELIDINLSKYGVPGLLLFTRIVPLKDFNMTSGVSFAFPGTLEKYLLKRYKILGKKVKSSRESVKRFVAFHKLSKTKGIETMYV